MATNHARNMLLGLLQDSFGPRVTVSEFSLGGVDYLITDGPATYHDNLFVYAQKDVIDAFCGKVNNHSYEDFRRACLPIGMMHKDVAIAIAEELGVNIRYQVANPDDLGGPRVSAYVLTEAEFKAAVARGFGD